MAIPRIGALVVGQSPRPEIEALLRDLAGPGVELDLRGALDGLSRPEIDALRPVGAADTLFTRLPNGDGVELSKRAVVAHGTERLSALADAGNDATIVMCTGEFADWTARFRVVFPSRTLAAMVRGCLPDGRLGVLAPLPEQCAGTEARWAAMGYDVRVVALSPNASDDETVTAARALAAHDPDLLVLDCISYTTDTKRLVRETAGVPTILAASSALRTALELAG